VVAGLLAEQGEQVKIKIIFLLIFLITLSFSVFGWNYIYGTKTIIVDEPYAVNGSYQVPVYKDVMDEICCKNINASCYTCKISNISCISGACYDYKHSVIDHYDIKYHDVTYQNYTNKTVEDTTKKLGVNTSEGTIMNPKVYVSGTTLSVWSVPIGDRNFKEYGKCREYEIKKGVCYKKENIQAEQIES